MAKKDHGFTYDEMEKVPYAKVILKKNGEARRTEDTPSAKS